MCNYPGSGHALLPVEHGMDAEFNISFWMDKFLIAPFEPSYVEEKAAAAEEVPAEENKEQ